MEAVRCFGHNLKSLYHVDFTISFNLLNHKVLHLLEPPTSILLPALCVGKVKPQVFLR
jgi:hypothetical protein